MLNQILSSELEGKGILGQPEIPGLTAAQMQKKMEELTRTVVIPAFNRLVDQQNKENDDRYTKLQTEQRINQKVIDIGTGDMAKAIYDPRGCGADIFASIPGRNLLDNSDFAQPVNQRGKAAYTSAGYTIDRWAIAYNQLAVVTGGISVTHADNLTSHIYQLLPSNSTGKTMTLTVATADGTFSVTGTMGNVEVAKDTPFGAIKFYLSNSCDAVLIDFSVKGSVLYWAKLEEGAVATPYVPKGYGAELTECLRYFYHGENKLQFGNTATAVCPGRDFPLPMRLDKPTVTIYGNGTAAGYVGAWGNATYATIAGIAVKSTGIAYVQANKNAAADGLWAYSFDASADL